MKRLAFSIWALLALWLMAPQTSEAAMHRLSDEYLDSGPAQGHPLLITHGEKQVQKRN